MKINSIINRYSDPATGGRRSEAAATESALPLEGFEPVIEAGDAKSQALRGILNKYDVGDITPREFSEMMLELRKEGLISDDQFQQLSLIRGELDQAGIDADESVDLVSFYEQRLAKMESAAAFDFSGDGESATDLTAKNDVAQRLAWIRKMAAAQESADILGLNAVA